MAHLNPSSHWARHQTRGACGADPWLIGISGRKESNPSGLISIRGLSPPETSPQTIKPSHDLNRAGGFHTMRFSERVMPIKRHARPVPPRRQRGGLLAQIHDVSNVDPMSIPRIRGPHSLICA